MKRSFSKWILVALSVLALSFLGAARAEACPGCDKKGDKCACAKKADGKCECAKGGKCACAKKAGGKCECAKGGDCPHQAGKECPHHAKKAPKK